MITLLLESSDTLFFRDGRPMDGSLAGHGAAWPLPSVLNGALHAALHRAQLKVKVHPHEQVRFRNGLRDRAPNDTRKFGSLVSAGPFPVRVEGANRAWFFPRPADALVKGETTVSSQPIRTADLSSLPKPLHYPVANFRDASKEVSEPWWSEGAWHAYLHGQTTGAPVLPSIFKSDADFADTEHSIGIGIDPATGTQDGKRIYSAHSLRLRDGWRLGGFAATHDSGNTRDLITALIGADRHIIIGGQQRVCGVERIALAPLPLPRAAAITGNRVKWVLLTPAVWPAIADKNSQGSPIHDRNGQPIEAHEGGWLPNWIRERDGQVMLRSGERQSRSYHGKHSRGFSSSTEIGAHLVAAIVPKPVVVTGWALPHEAAERADGGAKPTHLAVPAGAVYYFECTSAPEAEKLATALNWHGGGDASEIKNRRSTLLGEKGFGLGVCGTWEFHRDSVG